MHLNARSNYQPEGSVVMAGDVGVSSAIRELQTSDVESLRKLLIATDVFNRDEIDIALELIHCVLDKPGQQEYIIRVYDDGEVLGYYCTGPTPATDSTYDLYWIAVAPWAQGKGIGRLLNAHAEELIRSRGGRLVVAETSSTSRYDNTRRFYVSNRYTELSRIRDYYRNGDDLVVYGKYLSQ